ncbi:NAD(P)H-dependent oxidoreductase subunit E [Desulfobotulus sp.]|jgi:[NiFe] hydrogenase diaphorase moiety large subunit|uniref:NAD(P)H-dependent oxidoreductase subunit E n=1 Tax=Desulfobotulus sp. TaxID=1940337 RepID=UPI002A3586B6|nr:NAD(P)H-dependent oxidoreductase subunit E [Desulfobotulus sp.]MDY0163833.1 NAD(P)H-dependent oxidoreductase subunit E [Desulfobotulus sp.]
MIQTPAVSKPIPGSPENVVSSHTSRSVLLPELLAIQKKNGTITEKDVRDLAQGLGIHPVEVYSVVRFYSLFHYDKGAKHIIRICRGLGCGMKEKKKWAEIFEKTLGISVGQTTADGVFGLEYVSCLGLCDHAPAFMVDDTLYTDCAPEEVSHILHTHRSAGKRPDFCAWEIFGHAARSGPVLFAPHEDWSGLKKAFQLGRKAVVEEVLHSGLRGRGGAGFSTGLKWQMALDAKAPLKYVICNAGEGEPGTFKDRILLTEYVRKVFEGMLIAGFATGASQGILYLRGEYGCLLPGLESSLSRLREDQLLGSSVLGKKDFHFDIRVHLGSGAYVCGEETALIESLEGRRGEPRNRPPFSVEVGYQGAPTLVNNVETLASLPSILVHGASWFKGLGTAQSSGTKLLSVSGDCGAPGVYEVEYGVSIGDILDMVQADKAKAVVVGGAAGSCLPRKSFHRVLGYEDAATSGAFIILGQHRNLLDMAENFLQFFQEESCGQCTPCREGIGFLLESLRTIRQRGLEASLLEKILSLSETMRLASKCGLGQTASKVFSDVLNLFPEEYQRITVEV